MADQSPFLSGELEFLHTVERLKITERAGWKKPGRDIKAPESVSDHSYRMIIMGMISDWEGVDRTKVAFLAAVHDLGKSIVGDITPSDGIGKHEKYIREELAFEYMQCLLADTKPAFAKELIALWKEFEEGRTPEAKRARELDAFECLLQVDEYEGRYDKNIDDFKELETRITSPDLKQLWSSVELEKKARRARQDSIDLIIFVIGGPGVGKGTVCAQLARDFDFCHISVGDILRELIKPPKEGETRESPFAGFITNSMKQSVTVPPELSISLLLKEMDKASAKGKTKFLIDGFPRSVDQAVLFEQKVHRGNYTLLLDSTRDVMRERLERRAASSDRVDDIAEYVMRRFWAFQNQHPFVEHYLWEHSHVEMVKCVGTVNQVYDLVKPVVEKMIHRVENNG